MNKWMLMTGLAVTLLSADAMADNADINMRFGAQVAKDASYDAIDEDNILTYSTVELGYGVGAQDGLRLTLSYDMSTAPNADRLGGSYALDWTRYRFMLGAEYGVIVLKYVKPLVGISAGYALQDMTVRADDVRSDFTHDIAVEGYLGLDGVLTLNTFQNGNSLQLVAQGRLGYQMQTEARFDELDSEADDQWTRTENDIGVLDVNGMFWNLGVGVRYSF